MDVKNIREPIAYKRMFLYYFLLISHGILFVITIFLFFLGKFDDGLNKFLSTLMICLIVWSPFILLFIFKYKKPNVLISKNQDCFIIHRITKEIVIPMQTIRKITYWSVKEGRIIYIKTDTRFLKYSVQDIRNVDQVWSTMNSILRDYKDQKQSN